MTDDHRAQAIQTARELVQAAYLVIDTETTGLGDEAEIVDIAVVDRAGETILNTLIKPGCAIPAIATAIHGITDAAVEHAPAFIEAWSLLAALVRSRTVLTYNAPYDRRLIEQSLMASGFTRMQALAQMAGTQYRCIMQLYAMFNGEWDDYRGGYKWKRLEIAAASCGQIPYVAHRALGDAQAARAVLEFMASRNEEPS